ncbi:LIM domain only protein 7-like isoform X3 [Syngnathoides biaculeatus]|nr:LIM domain only protein 7-like isoform X2 [Syngnathoides biaculeatus]XP_061670992.1 LIM domain only protein 7-like isoform X3 [Syngnathoides biaculeatus]
MEWRQQSTFSCADAFNEARRWIEEVTGKPFGCSDFRAALENGVLLCDLINQLKPGIIKKLNRLSTPIAGLDNINVFLKACGKLGLNESQLFHPGDLQDLSTRAIVRRNEGSRRLKNVLITIYWLGRKAYLDDCYNGNQLNFKAFEGLLGLALSKALDDGNNTFEKDGACRDCSQPGRTGDTRETSVKSFDLGDARAPSANSEGCGSDAEAEQVFRRENTRPIKGHIPPSVLRRKRNEENRNVSTSLTRSKSLSDMPTVCNSHKVYEGFVGKVQDVGSTKWSQDRKWRSHSAGRDNETRWQDALTKWKNHRRNTKSNLRRKSLDREHVINKMTNEALTDHQKKEKHCAQSEREQLSAQRQNPDPPAQSTSPPKFSSSFLWTHRAPLAGSYATEVTFSAGSSYSHQNICPAQAPSVGAIPASDGDKLGEETHFASLTLNGAAVTTPIEDNAFSFQTQFKPQGNSAPVHPVTDLSQPENVAAQIASPSTPAFPGEAEPADTVDISNAFEDLSDHSPWSKMEGNENSSETSGDKSRCQSAANTKYLTRTVSWSCSASLPRGFKRSDGSCRLSSVITARPFQTKHSSMSTLPRLRNVNDYQSPAWESEGEATPSTTGSEVLKRQTATSYLRGQDQGPEQAANRVEQTASGKVECKNLSGQTFRTSCSQLQPQDSTRTAPRSCASIDNSKVDHNDMSVSLAPTQNSRPVFGFQLHGDTTGARTKYIQRGSLADLCPPRGDDEILTVDGGLDLAALMSSSLREEKITSAQQIGTHTMDMQRDEKKGCLESAVSDLQGPFLTPSTSRWSWDHEDDRRRQEKKQEEQERLLQSNLGMSNDIETTARGIYLNDLTKTKEQNPEKFWVKPQNSTQKDLYDIWAEDTSGFAPLSPAHRAKSLSTPALAVSHKQPKGERRKRKEEPLSKAEQERQQILEEMKKRTQLLTDNSWIRQRSSSFYKEPIYIGTPLKRYESLEALGTHRSTFTGVCPRPHSAAAGSCAQSLGNSTFYNAGPRPSQRSTTTYSHPVRKVSGRRTCSLCDGHLSSGAAMVIEALGLCFHFACFQCVGCGQYLGKKEAGVQVRVRNKKPYCEPCYFQLQ